MKKNYYKILGVSSNAGNKIKENFRRLAKKYYPDVSTIRNAENKFHKITEAYEILSNPKAKQEYDESLLFNKFDNVKYKDFFDFNNKVWSKKKTFNKPKKGPLLIGKVVLKAQDVIRLGKANVTLFVEENCTICQGAGYYFENGSECFCATCGSFGRYQLQKTIVVYLPSLSKLKQKVVVHRVGHAGYFGGERGDIRLKLILQCE
ncbi:DnaJ domain-containing protein [Spiroplasma endosymbiont of Stenodema calcarata]|uniref:J domain-containing protein n=1 Tax=Spiroplasma endosymbiont of Stenodema calcarata TaxID=3139328 RepID=UPI003CCAE937